VIYLTLGELIHVAERTWDGKVEVRDYGLLEAALARPPSSVFGGDRSVRPGTARRITLAVINVLR
jgi:hypothetical protein